MSELKAHHIIGLDGRCNSVDNDFYIKSEADKVIAELKEQIEVPKHQACKMDCMMVKHYNEVCDELRHQKYKRCLAMAKWCFEKSYSTTLVKYDKESGLLRNFYDWWGKRWLKLATEPTWEKFLQLIHKEGK